MFTVVLHEVLITDSFDLFLSLLHDFTHTTEAVLSCLLTLATGLVFLGVDLGALALETVNVLSETLTRSGTLLARITFFIDFGSLTFLTLGYLVHAFFFLGHF